MNMQLTWKANFSASCLHAAQALFDLHTICDERLSTALPPFLDTLKDNLSSAGIPPQRFWRHAVPLSAHFESNRELTELILRKAVGNVPRFVVDALTNDISGIEAAVAREYPALVEELQLRIGPIREQWEARGPGLLRTIGDLTDSRVLVPNAEVLVVQPVFGGAGVAHLEYNSVRIEGLLANTHQGLPETLRLAWLLAQLNSDLPTFADGVPGERLARIAQLAFIPAVLNSGEFVEWSVCDRQTICTALNAWNIPSSNATELAETLLDWWQTYRISSPRWEVGLMALDRMCLELEQA